MTQQFISLLERSKDKDLIPFLQSLTDADKKSLVPELKKLSKEYLEYKEVKTGFNTTHYKQKANDTQQAILLISSFVCFNRQDFERSNFPGWILDKKHLSRVIDWYCPGWFSDFVNKLGESEFMYHSVNYDVVMELTTKGLLKPAPLLVGKLLPQSIFESQPNHKYKYKPENLLKHPVTLQEHIWYLFELESNLHYSDRWLNFEKGEENDKQTWIQVFKRYAAEGKIERSRLLKEALLASNRNFNKILSGWFSELFLELEPTQEEILALQPELFTVLSSPQSKPVNTALQVIKKIVTEKEFDGAGFLDNASLLLTATAKNTVITTIGILEKLAKRDKNLALPVSKALVQVFLHANDELQARAAKIIMAHEDKLDDDFRQELAPYHPSFMASARKLLHKFYEPAGSNESAVQQADEIHDDQNEALTEIPFPGSIDDLVFLASQAFDNNQSWHIDILPAALLKWQTQLNEQNIGKLEPALQRALKLTKSEFRTGQGSLDHMLAVFFIDVCICLCRRYPNGAGDLLQLFSQFDQKYGDTVNTWMAIETGKNYLDGWDNHAHDPFYIPHKQLLITALLKIRAQDALPLLSTPTHEPAWILPETLVKRIVAYRQDGIAVFNIDFQVAVSRCLLQNTSAALELAEKQLSGETKNILLFLFGRHAEPLGPFENEAVWMCSSLAVKSKKKYAAFEKFAYYKKPFGNYTGQYPWEPVEEEYDDPYYDPELKKTVKRTAKRKVLQVTINWTTTSDSPGLKKLFGAILKKPAPVQEIIYDHFAIKATWLEIPYDVRRILLLTPNNPEPFLAEVVSRCFRYPTFWREEDKRTVIACLQTLHEIWNEPGEMAYLFAGTAMIASDKTVVNMAGETWIKAVASGKMNNALLAKVIGTHERIEFAPLKRLTDLVSQSLFKISAVHDKNLLAFVEALLVELPDEPIKNLKKLLEIYAELRAANHVTMISPDLQRKLKAWSENAGLQKLISGLT